MSDKSVRTGRRLPSREGALRPGLLVSCDVKDPRGLVTGLHSRASYVGVEGGARGPRVCPRVACLWVLRERGLGPLWSSLSAVLGGQESGSPLPENWAKTRDANSKGRSQSHVGQQGGTQTRSIGFLKATTVVLSTLQVRQHPVPVPRSKPTLHAHGSRRPAWLPCAFVQVPCSPSSWSPGVQRGRRP